MDTSLSGPLLIVEDVPDTLNLVELTLKFKGYRVVTATNGQEALKAIQAERPALIVTDILMPRMDGFSLVHQLRVQPETRDIPVIFLSATYVAPEDKAFAVAIGVTKFIEKPIVMDVLLNTVQELLAKPPVAKQDTLDQQNFYRGYIKRLEAKLEHKITQIARLESMLDTLTGDEKRTFQASLKGTIQERDEIQRLIIQIHDQITKKTDATKG